ncbi:MAG: ankyrin repeat domain-containing protein, partial [Pyrinomonadaceae bacterium]
MGNAVRGDDERPVSARALLRAAEGGDAEEVEALLAAGADVNATVGGGKTALMVAASRGHADVVRALLGAGASVNARSDNGFTALLNAVFCGHADVVRALLEKGADVSARTQLGSTAVNWASARGFVEIVELLKAGGPSNGHASTSSSTRDGNAPRSLKGHRAAEHDHSRKRSDAIRQRIRSNGGAKKVATAAAGITLSPRAERPILAGIGDTISGSGRGEDRDFDRQRRWGKRKLISPSRVVGAALALAALLALVPAAYKFMNDVERGAAKNNAATSHAAGAAVRPETNVVPAPPEQNSHAEQPAPVMQIPVASSTPLADPPAPKIAPAVRNEDDGDAVVKTSARRVVEIFDGVPTVVSSAARDKV